MNNEIEPSSEPPTGEIALPTTRGKDGMVTVHATGLAIITTMARGGHPVTSIAAALGMSARVMRECRKRQPEVEEAFAAGLGGLEHELVHSLLNLQYLDARDEAVARYGDDLVWQSDEPVPDDDGEGE